MTEAFNSQSVAFVDPQDTSRTFYMVASTDQERDAWVEAIRGNISAYTVSSSQAVIMVSVGGAYWLKMLQCKIAYP